MGWFATPRPAIEALVEAHYAALYRYAYRLSGSAPEAEDLTQETFCLAQDKLGQLREEAKAKSWLFTILRNAYLHRLRQVKQEKQVPLDGVAEIPAQSVEPATPIDVVHMQKVLGEMSEAFRTPLILYYFEEFSYKDIAEQMNLPLGTVMSRLARAKTFLRQRLTDHTGLDGKPNQGEVK
jgi:RNA polymerase sigma-70 factor, ECF subfamily